MIYFKINTNTGQIDLNYSSRLDRKTADTLNYAYALNGSPIRLRNKNSLRKTK